MEIVWEKPWLVWFAMEVSSRLVVHTLKKPDIEFVG
jgi:hypothetical protein